MITATQVLSEIEDLAAVQGLDRAAVQAAVQPLAAHLGRYAELVLTETGLEVITGGRGVPLSLAAIARQHGIHERAIESFLDIAARYPATMHGVKVVLDAAPQSPSLYIRLRIPATEGAHWLHHLPEVRPHLDALTAQWGALGVLYGLGFTGTRALTVKSYVLGFLDHVGSVDLGFISHRIGTDGLSPVSKRYRPDVPWDALAVTSPGLARIARFAEETLGYQIANHFGQRDDELKIYVERIGSIPTDYAAR